MNCHVKQLLVYFIFHTWLKIYYFISEAENYIMITERKTAMNFMCETIDVSKGRPLTKLYSLFCLYCICDITPVISSVLWNLLHI